MSYWNEEEWASKAKAPKEFTEWEAKALCGPNHTTIVAAIKIEDTMLPRKYGSMMIDASLHREPPCIRGSKLEKTCSRTHSPFIINDSLGAWGIVFVEGL